MYRTVPYRSIDGSGLDERDLVVLGGFPSLLFPEDSLTPLGSFFFRPLVPPFVYCRSYTTRRSYIYICIYILMPVIILSSLTAPPRPLLNNATATSVQSLETKATRSGCLERLPKESVSRSVGGP